MSSLCGIQGIICKWLVSALLWQYVFFSFGGRILFFFNKKKRDFIERGYKRASWKDMFSFPLRQIFQSKNDTDSPLLHKIGLSHGSNRNMGTESCWHKMAADNAHSTKWVAILGAWSCFMFLSLLWQGEADFWSVCLASPSLDLVTLHSPLPGY